MTSPTATAMTKTVTRATSHPCSWLTISATAAPAASPTMLPKDRSKSPMASTTVSPEARISSGVNPPVERMVRRMLSAVRKASQLRALKKATRPAKTISRP